MPACCWACCCPWGEKGEASKRALHSPEPSPLLPDKLPLNNAVDSTGVTSLGRPHGHSKRPLLGSSLSPPAPNYTAYSTLTAGGEQGVGARRGMAGRGQCTASSHGPPALPNQLVSRFSPADPLLANQCPLSTPWALSVSTQDPPSIDQLPGQSVPSIPLMDLLPS